MLEAQGLDDARLVSELNARLGARKTEFFRGAPVADCDDNGTRMRATELLAELLGRKKYELDLNHHSDDGLTLILDKPSDAPPTA